MPKKYLVHESIFEVPMLFLQNAWYAAAWANELGPDTLLSRTLLDEPVLLYRDDVGTAHALGNRCPHRFAPLHLGKRHGGDIECGYHGLLFNAQGACVLNPHGSGRIAANMKVPAWPLAERYGVLWIWIGDPQSADEARIPDVGVLVDPALGIVRGSMLMQADYQLVADNLLDLSHTQFLHANFLKTPGLLSADRDAKQEGTTVFSEWKVTGQRAPSRYARFMDDPSIPVDQWLDSRWDPPGIIRLDVGVTPTGESRERGMRHFGTHLLTPETRTTTHYFYASIRNYRVGDPEADEFMRLWHRTGFGEQDKPMIEAVQKMMGDAEFAALRPVLLESDGAALRARSVMRHLIEQEQEQPAAAGV